MGANDYDVLIIGAGLSGIGAACHLEERLPNKRYAILEGRERMGGTWDLFRYPGIRSDSDMYTLGYRFRPWKSAKAIADGPSILTYIEETARDYGVEDRIQYQRRVERASFSSADDRWRVEVRDLETGTLETYSCAFLFTCTGYYAYEAGYTPEFPGRERFEGELVHPQLWPEGLDYEGKRVVVIGSGATAVTLVPAMAETASHVTMLQRSPTYVLTAPEQDAIAEWLKARLPDQTAYGIVRWKNILISMGLYGFCRAFPQAARKLIRKGVDKELGDPSLAEPHFEPDYDPWDQRLCLVPDADLFRSIREGKASVVTDRIETFTERGLKLASGEELEADIVITATGLEVQFLGGMTLEVDGKEVVPTEHLTYKAMMLSDVPNLALAVGYTNASWTLKCDLTAEYVCRLLQHMDRHGYSRACPRRPEDVKEAPLLGLTSGYVQRAADRLPRQGSQMPWKLYQNYILDLLTLRYAPIDDGTLELSKPAEAARSRAATRPTSAMA